MSLFIDSFVSLYIEMAPYLTLGLFVAGLLHVFINRAFIISHFGGKGVFSVIKASLLGIPLPLCSCSVVPTALSLKKHGATNGSTVSFLISTPQTGVESIAATWGMMGPLFAIFRPIAAFITGTVGGLLANKVPDIDNTVTDQESNDKTKLSFINKIKELIRYGFSELMDDIGLNLLAGVAISALITILVPENFFKENIGNSFIEMIIMIIGGVPLYICSTASIPIAAALILKGISPAAAFVFLIVGPATNAATITMIYSKLGKQIAAVYLGTIISLAIPFGYLLNWLYEKLNINPMIMAQHLHEKNRSIFMIVITLFFTIALIYSLYRTVVKDTIYKIKLKFRKDIMMDSKTYSVSGMTCNNCARHVREAVGAVDGVSNVEINLEDKSILVAGNSNILDIKSAVEKAGYKFEQ